MTTLEILFIHLGTKPPPILYKNLEWLRANHPQVKLHLATDVELDPKLQLDGVEHFVFPQNAGFYSLVTSPHSTNFRKGYWLHTIRRLLAIEEWHRTRPDVAVLHIESDMLLLSNFPFQAFERLKSLAWPRVSEVRDMPGLLFSPSHTHSQWLAKAIWREVKGRSDTTDMLALRRIALENPTKHCYLPVSFYELGNDKCTGNGQPDFKGIFDGLTLGMWLTGEDPRNNWGFVKYRHNESHVPDVSKLQLMMSNGNILVRDKDTGLNLHLYNIHVHSKRLDLFKPSLSSKKLRRLVENSNKKNFRLGFSFSGLLGAFLQLYEAALAKLFGIRYEER